MKQSILTDINTIETNFRAEVIASGLIENGFEADKILIVRDKGNKKDVSKDVDKLEYQYSGFNMMEYLYIYTNRESIYDSLPEGLFHQPSGLKNPRSKEDIIYEIKHQRDNEKLVRKFFQPFEMVFDRILVEAQSYEQKYDKAHFYTNLTDILKEYWDILKHLSTGQALLFIKIIPIIAEVSRDLDLTAKVMSVILNCPVEIEEGEKSRIGLFQKEKVKLGDWKLGVNSILDDEVAYPNLDLVINVGPLNLSQMRLFESNRKNDLILKELISLMIPFDRNTNIRYQTIKSETKFRLSDKGHTAYLGINTTL